jgi:hypothetical protein
MPVPYTFGTATAAIPLSQLDSNFATAITLGNTAVYLGNTTTSIGNLTLTNVTISSGNVTLTNVSVTTANVSGTANITTLVTTNDATIQGVTVGRGAGAVATNTAVGASALAANSGGNNTSVGAYSLLANTTGAQNSAFGTGALEKNTTGANGTAVGVQALNNNTTASENTAVGYQALYTNTTGAVNVAVGKNALQNSNSSNNTAVGGGGALYSLTSGANNTAVGFGAGYNITTGAKNTIIGSYNGNQGGLDIRTASNYIVLSDGDGNPRGFFNNSGDFFVATTGLGTIGSSSGFEATAFGSIYSSATNDSVFARRSSDGTVITFRRDTTSVGSIGVSTVLTTYNTTSDYRLKNITGSLTGFKDFIMALNPKQGTWKADGSKFVGFLAHEFQEVSPSSVSGVKDAVDADGNPIMQSMQASSSEVIANLVAHIQNLEVRLAALESN